MWTKKPFTFKDFLFHKTTLIVTGIVALGIVGISIWTKAMPTEPVPTAITSIKTTYPEGCLKLAEWTIAFDAPISAVTRVNQIVVVDPLNIGKENPAMSATVNVDGTLNVVFSQDLVLWTNYEVIVKPSTLVPNNTNDIIYSFTATCGTTPPVCTGNVTLTKANPSYTTSLGGTFTFDGSAKLNSTELEFSSDNITWTNYIDLSRLPNPTNLYVRSKSGIITLSNVVWTNTTAGYTVSFDVEKDCSPTCTTSDVTLNKDMSYYTFDNGGILKYNLEARIYASNGIEISADWGKTRVLTYSSVSWPTTLLIRDSKTLIVTELTKVAVDPKVWTFSFSISKGNCDADKDGVEDALDLCADTKTSDSMVSLNPNHFMVQNFVWVTNAGSNNTPVIQPATFTIKDTLGCSCEQILAGKPGNNWWELKFWCTKGTMDNFIQNRWRGK